MLDKLHGVKIRKTKNGMRPEDGFPAPPQHRKVIEVDEKGRPVDLEKLIARQ